MERLPLSIGVTAHPDRLQYLDPLLEKLHREVKVLNLPSATVQLYMDSDNQGYWANSRRAWLDAPFPSFYRLVLMDDVVICRDFIAAMMEALMLRAVLDNGKDFVTHPFTSTAQPLKALQRGKRWFEYTQVHAQALTMPTPLVGRFTAWVDEGSQVPTEGWGVHPKTKERFLHYDYALKVYCKQRGIPRYGMVPNLVQHVGGQTSLLGHTWSNMQERQINISQVFIGENMSGLGVDWSQP